MKRPIPILAVLAAGCTSPVTPTPDYGNVGRVVVEGADAGYGDDDFVVEEATLDGDTLRARVSYGGGCESHAMTLVISASFIETSPVRLRSFFRHEANGDPCQAWLTEDWVFELTLVRERYETFYGPGPGAVVLQLDLDGASADLLYEFGIAP